MYLKSLRMINFRKFRTEENTVEFVNSKGIHVKTNETMQEDIKDKEQENNDNINVASVTTLIVGKNNAGKTTVITALDKLLSKGNEKAFVSSDFNLRYLEECLLSIEKNPEECHMPYMEFVVKIALEEDSDDRITNLIPFMLLEDTEKSELEIHIKYELEETQKFIESTNAMLKKYGSKNEIRLYKFLGCIDKTDFKINYYDKNGQSIDKDFKLMNLIDFQLIGANKITKETCLSETFNKIVKYQHEHVFKDTRQELEEPFDKMNLELTEKIHNRHTVKINDSLSKIVSMNHMKVNLTADITFEKILKDLIKYQYVEKDLNIPENQFGMGYTNLMMIIAALIDYMEHYPDTSFNSKINIIAIEEPETYMHPQMQELFIKNINDAISALLASSNKKINSQLIVTTHSSHILNSKIHSGNSFDNINYIYEKSNCSRAVNLHNSVIMPSYAADKENEEFKFLKKHIKYKVSELFFSDAIIFVEGLTEETLLPYYIEQQKGLDKYYISIFNINGAHAFLYYDLIKAIGVPTLIITDLDIKKELENKEEETTGEEIDDYKQIQDLSGMITTNQTIIKFLDGEKDISAIKEFISKENVYLTYQGKIDEYYATSFEEAFILSNYENDILNEVLKELKPRIYKSIVGKEENKKNNYVHSREWQKKLSDSKGDFAGNMLFKIVLCDDKDKRPKLPDYIKNGLLWLENKLKEGEANESNENK